MAVVVSRGGRKLVSIQILRCLAAIVVVLYHIGEKIKVDSNTGFFQVGAIGVDIFFIVSGFIMMLVSQRETKATVFLKKRFVRIFPIYWVYTTIALMVFVLFPGAINSTQGGTAILQSYFLIPVQGKSFLLLVAWTLSYEMLFYILFSIGLFFKLNQLYFLTATVTSLVVIGAISDEYYAHKMLSPIMLEFLVGVWMYYLYNSKIIVGVNNWGNILYIALPLLILLSFVFINNAEREVYTTIMNNRYLFLCIPAVSLFGFVVLVEKKLGGGKIVNGLSYIGNTSYSLYLSHLFAINAVFMIFKFMGLDYKSTGSAIAAFFIAILVGIASYEVIERRVLPYCIKKILSKYYMLKFNIKNMVNISRPIK
ncbi:acyltransferase family protein [Klebsiella aerogenes]